MPKIRHTVGRNDVHHRTRTRTAAAACIAMFTATLSANAFSFLSHHSSTIQAEVDDIETQLLALPSIPPPSTPQTLGYRSRKLDTQNEEVTIEITFDDPANVDLVVLMPAAFSDWSSKLMAFGFPEGFYIERILPDGSTDMIADHRTNDYRTTGIEPQLFPCADPRPTSGIRITTTACSSVQPPGRIEYTVAFSEIYVFSGNKNVALNARVKTSNSQNVSRVWNEEYLTDGFTLYPPLNLKPNNLQVDFRASAKEIAITYDLGSEKTIDELRLWPTSSTRPYLPPLIYGSDFPSRITLEKVANLKGGGANLLFQSVEGTTPIPGTQPFMHHIPPSRGRFFRLTLGTPFSDPRIGASDRIALAEIELLENGQTQNRDIVPRVVLERMTGRLQSSSMRLSDGLTSEGEIIPLRRWLVQFRLRNDLLQKKALLERRLEMARRYEQERTTVVVGAGLVLIVVLLFMVLIVRLLAMRRWAKMREQIATDLHDEIGANLSSIVHSGEIAKELLQTPDDPLLDEVLSDVVNTARLTANETRQFVRLLEDRENGVEAMAHIRKTAQQILGNIPYTCTFEENRIFNLLNPARKWDLLFFIKEALNNIAKHACANHVEIITRRHGKKLQLTIIDDGSGIPHEHYKLHHLESRARRLRADMDVKTAPGQGTRIELTFKKRRIG